MEEKGAFTGLVKATRRRVRFEGKQKGCRWKEGKLLYLLDLAVRVAREVDRLGARLGDCKPKDSRSLGSQQASTKR